MPSMPMPVLLAVLLSFLAAPAVAQTGNAGAYLGLQAGRAQVKEWCDGIPSGFACDDIGVGWRIFGGYPLHPNFALELGYADLGTATLSSTTASAQVDSKAVDLAVVAALPLGRAFTLFGKFGFYRGHVSAVVSSGTTTPFSQSDSGTEMTFGFGAQLEFAPNVGLRAEWQKYNDFSGSDIDLLTLGLLFRFGN